MEPKKNYEFWSILEKGFKNYPSLNSNETCDVVIIGGGIAGCLTAYYLSQYKLDVVLIEKNLVTQEDRTSNIGFLDSNTELDISLLQDLIGKETALKVNKLCKKSIDDIENILYNLNHSEILERKFIKYLNSYYENNSKECAVINPFKFCHLLLKNCIKKHARIYENTSALSYDYYSNKIKINTSNSKYIECKKIIFTDIPFCYKLIEEWDILEFSKTYSIVTNKLDFYKPSISENCLISEKGDELYTYIIPTTDKRFIISEFNGVYSENKSKELLEKFKTLMPKSNNLDDLKSDYFFYNDFAKSPDSLPYIGKHPKFNDCYFNLATGRNPICYSVIGAQIIKDLILYEHNPYEKLFSFERR